MMAGSDKSDLGNIISEDCGYVFLFGRNMVIENTQNCLILGVDGVEYLRLPFTRGEGFSYQFPILKGYPPGITQSAECVEAVLKTLEDFVAAMRKSIADDKERGVL